MTGVISRIAPTPSGYLHEGNLVNFLATAWIVDAHAGMLALRIDDMDATRCRPEYVEDIFRLLHELDISWHVGPRDTADFFAVHSLQRRTDYYRERLGEMRAHGLPAYVCACSRTELQEAGSTSCVRNCRDLDLPLTPEATALRADVGNAHVQVGARRIDLAATVGDFVIWRRDDLVSYHLASLLEDDALGTTHIVRGLDLLASSAAQLWLAHYLPHTRFTDVTFIHHALLLDAGGNKLSKSTLRNGPLTLTDEIRARIHRSAAAALSGETAR